MKNNETFGLKKTSESLFLTFIQQRAKGSPASGPIVKALFLQNNFQEVDAQFSASIGWLNC